jgi:AAT family amino acid transporter
MIENLTRAGRSDMPLRRELKSRHLQLIALGGIIGSGYFLGTAEVLRSVGPAAVLAYAFGGLVVVCVMFCLGELTVAAPVPGSFVAYSRRLISPTWACGVGWSYWITWVTYVPAEMIAAGMIMESFVPEIGRLWWSLAFGAMITGINLFYVKAFGEVEFWLSLVKIAAIVLFAALAFAILVGVAGAGSGTVPLRTHNVLLTNYWALLSTMVLVLVNFQGAEIIGLAAGESEEPSRNVGIAVRNVAWRVVLLYVVPLALLVCIFPWDEAEVSQSVFAAALERHGFLWAAAIFSLVVLSAAVSCSNSGLYSCSRALFALAQEGLAPAWLGQTNRFGVPQNATLLSIAGCWVALLVQVIDPADLFVKLLAMSGFSGAIAWISICWSQLRFRREREIAGNPTRLKFSVPLFPYLTHFGIWAQVGCLCLMATSDSLRDPLLFGVPALLAPMIWYLVRKRWFDRPPGLTQAQESRPLQKMSGP